MQGRLYISGKEMSEIKDLAGRVPYADVELSNFTGGDDPDYRGGSMFDFSGGLNGAAEKKSNTIGDFMEKAKDKLQGIVSQIKLDTKTNDAPIVPSVADDNASTTSTGMHPVTLALTVLGTVAVLWVGFKAAKHFAKKQATN